MAGFFTRNKTYFVMIREAIHQEDKIIVLICMQPKYTKQKLTDVQ